LGGVLGGITASQITSRLEDLRQAMTFATYLMLPECVCWCYGFSRSAALGYVARFCAGWGMALLLVLAFTYVHR